LLTRCEQHCSKEEREMKRKAEGRGRDEKAEE